MNCLQSYKSKSVANTIKKFDQLDSNTNTFTSFKSSPLTSPEPHQANEKITNYLSSPSKEKPKLTSETTLKCKSPSPSLMRKTQSFMAKEKTYETTKKIPSPRSTLNEIKSTKQPSHFEKNVKTSKPMKENFQKAAAFWNQQK